MEWISVTTGFPTYRGRSSGRFNVLVAFEDDRPVTEVACENKVFYNKCTGFKCTEVTHWSHMPKPPK